MQRGKSLIRLSLLISLRIQCLSSTMVYSSRSMIRSFCFLLLGPELFSRPLIMPSRRAARAESAAAPETPPRFANRRSSNSAAPLKRLVRKLGPLLPGVDATRLVTNAFILDNVDGRKIQLTDFISPTIKASLTALLSRAALMTVFINLASITIRPKLLL